MKKILSIVLFILLSIPVVGFTAQVEQRPVLVFRSIERSNITTASVNILFAFTNDKVSVKILVETPSSNSDDICIDWLGGTAACPATNTAGNQRLHPGTSLLIDNISINNVSVIAASGTQTINITAWR